MRLSPINRRRWENFKRNRRGFVSFWIFLSLFCASMASELICNDRPLLVAYKGQWLFPVLFNYSGDTFGGFELTTDYRDASTQDEIEAHGYMIWPPIRFANNTTKRDVPTGLPSPPTWTLSEAQCKAALAEHPPRKPPADGGSCRDLEPEWLGTDMRARDVVARLFYGFRISVLFGLILAAASSAIGVAAGAVQGYFGGRVDLVMQRGIEIWSSQPQLYILIILSSVLAPSFWVLLTILLLFSWTHLVSVVRAEVLRTRNFEYVNAARALGLTDYRIIVKHVLPNATVATLTFAPFIVNTSIGALTSLDYLGLGLPPDYPSLGELLQEGTGNLSAPWLALSAFFTVAIMLSLLVFIGEAVRDAFDPRKSYT